MTRIEKNLGVLEPFILVAALNQSSANGNGASPLQTIPDSSITFPDNLTSQQAEVLGKELRSIPVNGAPIDLEHLYLGQLLREIFSGKRDDLLKSLHINDESRTILQRRFVEGIWWRDINEGLGKVPVSADANSSYDGRQNAEGRAKYAIAKITHWLEPLGATPETMKKVLDNLSEVKAESRKNLSKAENYIKRWLESFHQWIDGKIKRLRPIEFNLYDKDIASAFVGLIEKLKIKLPRLLEEGKLRPSKDKLGYVLEVQNDSGDKILQRQLMAYNTGRLLEPPREGSPLDFLIDRTGGKKFSLHTLINGFGPVNLLQALDTVTITIQDRGDKQGTRVIDFRVRKDRTKADLDFGYQIPIPSIYSGSSLKPQISVDDLKIGNSKITFCDPKSNKPVIEVIFTEKGYETNYLGKYANPDYWRGATKKVSYEAKRFLQGKRVTKPLLHELNINKYEGHSYLRFLGISVDLGKDFLKDKVSPAFLATHDGEKSIGIYLNKSDSEPYLILKMDGEEVKVESNKL